jgi:pyruvate/2-oxoglutarate dehydrogenase complex dihydrolipoamide acyltransferase (E2) component
MTWLEAFKECFGHRAQALALRRYIQGLLSDSDRKSMQAMLARVTDPGSYQAFQHFVTNAPWSADRVWRRLRRIVPDKAAPSVRLLARKLRIDIQAVRATGPDGRVLVDDLTTGAAKRFGIPVLPLLRRVRETGQQVGRDRTARERSVRGAFAPTGRALGLRICLIDDVLTTGATASAAAAALLEAGAARVEVRTLARAP